MNIIDQIRIKMVRRRNTMYICTILTLCVTAFVLIPLSLKNRNGMKSPSGISQGIGDKLTKFRENFDNPWNINQELFEQINQLISPGDTVLEFGSGGGTEALTSMYNVYSIEHDLNWVNYVNKSHYIYAPLKNYDIREFPNHKMWYDVDVIKAKLPSKYDLILVDGPLGLVGRGGFYQFINLFDTSVPIILDDVHRSDELKLAQLVSKKLNRSMKIFNTNKAFAVIDKLTTINKSRS